jgi:hypothetical protein
MSPSDPDARVAKMKDGTTHLAHKAEHAVDMESGAVIAVTGHSSLVGNRTCCLKWLRVKSSAGAIAGPSAGSRIDVRATGRKSAITIDHIPYSYGHGPSLALIPANGQDKSSLQARSSVLCWGKADRRDSGWIIDKAGDPDRETGRNAKFI